MPFVNEKPREEGKAAAGRRLDVVHREPESFRLDFRSASNHLDQKRPGYYLILLRTEIKHRSLREKRTLIG